MTEIRYLHSLMEERLAKLSLEELAVMETGPFIFPIGLFQNFF